MLTRPQFILPAVLLLVLQLLALWVSLGFHGDRATPILAVAFPFAWLSRAIASGLAAQFALHLCLSLCLLYAALHVGRAIRRLRRPWAAVLSPLYGILIATALCVSYVASLRSIEPGLVATLTNWVIPQRSPRTIPPPHQRGLPDTELIEPGRKSFPTPFPHFVTYRPAHGSSVLVNPPRFSWPYLKDVIPATSPVPKGEFVLQIARSLDFTNPETEVRTPLNFYNALAPLATGRWYWRVGYLNAGTPVNWGLSRSFEVSPGSATWDRSHLTEAEARLSGLAHPRLGPPEGDWRRWRLALQQHPDTAAKLQAFMADAVKTTHSEWWQVFPPTDRWLWSKHNEGHWASISLDLARACLASRLTPDPQFSQVKDHVLRLSSFPIGGRTSPEFNGGKTKLATQVTEGLALCYDWLYDTLTPSEREQIVSSIEWRLDATINKAYSYQSPRGLHANGVAILPGSHPFENFMWSMPAVLLTAGDSRVADSVLDLALNYLTGITFAFGPDEGFNEGYIYAINKSDSVLNASLYTKLLLPELTLERNPVYQRFGDWLSAFPIGIERLSFSEYEAYPEKAYPALRKTLEKLAWVTGDGRFLKTAQKIETIPRPNERENRLAKLPEHHLEPAWSTVLADLLHPSLKQPLYPYPRPWLDLLSHQFTINSHAPALRSEFSAMRVFPDAGWVMASNRVMDDGNSFGDEVGMIFMSRPRGGYSHSYRAENSFVWYAYGRTLSAGGGTTLYPDPHARATVSHNALLIDGQGQEWNPQRPSKPFVGQVLGYRESGDYAYWVGDATNAYQSVPALDGWQRHVVFVNKKWIVMFDEIRLKPQAQPATFSFLFKVPGKSPLKIVENPDLPLRVTYQIGDVEAQLSMAHDSTDVKFTDLVGREGFRNPVTGKDFYPDSLKVLHKFRNTELPDERSIIHHNMAITTRQPQTSWSFLTVLTATKTGEQQPHIEFHSGHKVTLRERDGGIFSISFSPSENAEFIVDASELRNQARSTRQPAP